MSSQSRRDELLDRAMDLLRPAAKEAGLTQEEYLVEVLEGRRPVPGPLPEDGP